MSEIVALNIQENIDLKPFNTFGLSALAVHYAEVCDFSEVRTAIKSNIKPVAALGGGSNILFTNDVPGLLLHNKIMGKTIVRKWRNKVHLKVGGGENWHELVLWSIENGFGGLENLSLIPGTVGASPVQNIGAYGVELKDVFVRLEAVRLSDGQARIFSKADCQFGYRDSIFKRDAKGKFMITSVTFALTQEVHHAKTQYDDVLRTLEEMGAATPPTIKEISDAIIRIRSSKLPDPAKIGNCGSFFKNPEVHVSMLIKIQETHPNVPSYPLPADMVKIPAGWLIEQCGWKGKRVGNTGCYEKQALVLVNYGGATGTEVLSLVQEIIASVKEKFGVALEPEVNIWPSFNS